MKKLFIVLVASAAALAGLAVLIVHELPKAVTYAIGPEKTPTRVEYYHFDPSSKLEDRIKAMPPELFDHYRNWDKAPDYAVYEPTAEDKALVTRYLALLPGVYGRVFQERCLGIYFIKGLKGNGITSWAEDKDGKVFFHVTLNPDSLRKDLSATLTEREASCFIPREGWSVKVNAGASYKGLLYALSHEATHGVDYVKGVTPWADDDMPARLRPAHDSASAIFFKPFWLDFHVPAKGYDFPLRDKITFYGLNGGPKIDFTDAPALYKDLERSPFASLYGSKSWAEDFAELATFHLLTLKLKQPYSITLTGPGASLKLEPMAREAVYQRAALVMHDLDPAGGHIRPDRDFEAKLKDVDGGMERTRRLMEKAEKMLKDKNTTK